ncbi:hypothetical protein [Desulfofundulus thermocisternus]|uniref:hypothetical protein n=1 Tax=Desulfofundulus thermocisternus TaxID=42471 RepID=UPI00217D535F|nr:hypothetical protein [Desulfofundulus thermocisternus]MCS5696986.1 hypothetical protein [Desulfofundulus thermocisternus]
MSKTDSLKLLTDTYYSIENIRMNLYKEIQDLQAEHEDFQLIDGAKTEIAGNTLKITIPDFPPRIPPNHSLNKKVRLHWLGMVVKALSNVEIRFTDKVLCIIHLYLPYSVVWDVDNRVFQHIINGIRYSRIIQDDSWDKLAFMVIGDVDKNNPRTEVIITKCPDNIQEFISKNADGH